MAFLQTGVDVTDASLGIPLCRDYARRPTKPNWEDPQGGPKIKSEDDDILPLSPGQSPQPMELLAGSALRHTDFESRQVSQPENLSPSQPKDVQSPGISAPPTQALLLPSGPHNRYQLRQHTRLRHVIMLLIHGGQTWYCNPTLVQSPKNNWLLK
jgi:hypothetical protein